jgi:hypothetical protein
MQNESWRKSKRKEEEDDMTSLIPADTQKEMR